MQKASPASTVPFWAIASDSHSCRILLFHPETGHEPGRLHIHVLFTNLIDTRAALITAVEMAAGLESEIVLIVPQIVPFPLSLDQPPVALDFASGRIRSLAQSVATHRTGFAKLQGYIFLCRNPIETLLQELPGHSLVVIGTRERWSFSKSKRMARALRRNGHEVVLANHG